MRQGYPDGPWPPCLSLFLLVSPFAFLWHLGSVREALSNAIAIVPRSLNAFVAACLRCLLSVRLAAPQLCSASRSTLAPSPCFCADPFPLLPFSLSPPPSRQLCTDSPLLSRSLRDVALPAPAPDGPRRGDQERECHASGKKGKRQSGSFRRISHVQTTLEKDQESVRGRGGGEGKGLKKAWREQRRAVGKSSGEERRRADD